MRLSDFSPEMKTRAALRVCKFANGTCFCKSTPCEAVTGVVNGLLLEVIADMDAQHARAKKEKTTNRRKTK